MVVVFDVGLLQFVGVPAFVIASCAVVAATVTAGGMGVLRLVGVDLPDRRAHLLCGLALGLVSFALLCFATMHRVLLGGEPRLAALVALLPPAALGLWELRRRLVEGRLSPAAPSGASLALVAGALLVALLTAYGHGNSAEGVLLDRVGLAGALEELPTWGFHTDRVVHIEQLVPLTAEEGFPPSRVNHRAVHVVLMATAALAGDVTPSTALGALKAFAPLLHLALAMGLALVGQHRFGLSRRLATLVALSGLAFSPLKLPLVAPSPTYRGFFSASGTFYHSDTQLWATAIVGAALLLLLTALDRRTPDRTFRRTFLVGCVLLGGSFFFKPSMFTVVVPALALTAALTGRPSVGTWARGMVVLAAVAVAYVGYVALTPGSSPVDGIVAGQVDAGSEDQLGIAWAWFDGYVPRVRDRFPPFISSSPVLVLGAMTLLSFAAFWVAWVAAGARLLRELQERAGGVRAVLGAHAPQVLALATFVLGIGSAVALSTADGKGINFRWAAAAAYPLALPLFAGWITRVQVPWLRRASWAVYLVQTAQGVGYLLYFSYRSSLV